MDRKTSEAAAQTLVFINQELAPMYQEARASFLGMLAASGASMASLRAKQENDSRNRELVNNFANLLPPASWCYDHTSSWEEGDEWGSTTRYADWYSGEFTTEDPYEALAAQSSTIWMDRVKGERKDAYLMPYFIVGLDILTGEMLLAKANVSNASTNNAKADDEQTESQEIAIEEGGDERVEGKEEAVTENEDEQAESQTESQDATPYLQSKIYLVSPKSKKTRRIRQGVRAINASLSRIHGMYTPAQVESMYQRGDSMLHVSRKTAGSLVWKKTGSIDELGFLSDEQMLNFKVMDYLNRLALVFDKTDDLAALLVK